MRDLIILGAGSVGRAVHEFVEDINAENKAWNLIGFLDKDVKLHKTELNGLPILGDIYWLQQYPNTAVVVAINSPSARCSLVCDINNLRHSNFATLIHPRAWLSRSVQIASGTIIYPGVLINIAAKIGNHVIINKGSTVGHDTLINDYVSVNPGVNVGGAVTVSEGCELGINSTIIQELSIGEWSIIGAGAVVIRDLPAYVTAVGVPARVIKVRQRNDTIKEGRTEKIFNY